MKQEFIEDNIIILSKQTLDVMLEGDNPSDLMGLYNFYYYTAKWQKTNTIKCSTNYVAKGLKWSKDRVIRAKKELKDIGLITDVVKKNKKGKIIGWYIKINYVWKKETVKTHCLDFQRVDEPEGGKSDTNALSVNSLNALSANTNIAKQSFAEVNSNPSLKEKRKKPQPPSSADPPAPFNFQEELDKMKADKQRHIQIIALYWKYYGVDLENKDQYQSALKRELRGSKRLIGYSDDRILETMDWLRDNADYKWTLETIHKFIDDDLELLSQQKKKW